MGFGHDLLFSFLFLVPTGAVLSLFFAVAYSIIQVDSAASFVHFGAVWSLVLAAGRLV
jgi:hypothetical protein